MVVNYVEKRIKVLFRNFSNQQEFKRYTMLEKLEYENLVSTFDLRL